MPPQLVSLTEGPSILLDKPILLLGRHPECDIQIESRKISRRHCCIAQVSDYLVVRDLGSTNGVRINGTRVNEGRLNEGDELTIGTLRYQVNLHGEEESLAPRKREAAPPPRKPPPRHADDDFLESADEPVPLSEPRGRPVLPPNLPFDLIDPGQSGASHHTEDGTGPRSHILPDKLELAPASGEVQVLEPQPEPEREAKPEAAPSGSHPPG
jgi:pSer/pThr/pTyr-binding forkhead associated (FHA) protein